MRPFAAELEEAGVTLTAGASEGALRCAAEHTAAVMRSRSFAEGRVTVQGETALNAARLLEARAGERLLDLCAAPGGKTAVLLASGASVVACDVGRGTTRAGG